jgi:hypothetical protein
MLQSPTAAVAAVHPGLERLRRHTEDLGDFVRGALGFTQGRELLQGLKFFVHAAFDTTAGRLGKTVRLGWRHSDARILHGRLFGFRGFSRHARFRRAFWEVARRHQAETRLAPALGRWAILAVNLGGPLGEGAALETHRDRADVLGWIRHDVNKKCHMGTFNHSAART